MHSAQVSGQTRSLLFFVLHQALPLLYRPWIASFYKLPSTCVLCGEGVEDYVHLFVQCRRVRSVWREAVELLLVLRLSHLLPLTPHSCLIGSPATPHSRPSRVTWVAPEPPTPSAIGRWIALTWTEVRGVVINVVWLERNRVLHSAPPRVSASKRRMKANFWHSIRLVAIGKRWPHRENQQGSGDRAAFYKYLWAQSHALISERVASPLIPHSHTLSNA